MQSSTKIVSAVFLLVAFTLFNVGVPVVYYLCPMMSIEMPYCDMSPQKADGDAAIAGQTPACCSKVVVAERNTTPFVQLHSPHSLDFKSIVVEFLIPASLTTSAVFASAIFDDGSPPQATSPPLFLLNAALLI